MTGRQEGRPGVAGLLLVLAMLLAGCPGGSTAPAEATPPAIETVAATAVDAGQQPTTPPMAPTPTEPVPTATPTTPPPSPSPTTPPPTPTTPPTDTPSPTPVPPTDTPTPAPTATATPEPADAVVLAAQLNVRAGPGTGFGTVGALARDDALEVVGQSGDCAWLQVRTTAGLEGWVAHVLGGTEYTALNIPCDSVPEVVVPTPTPRPQPTPRPTQPPAAPTPEPEGEPELPADMGCYLIQNQIGAELTFTITGNQFSETFRVPPMTDVPICLYPGRYTYTIDAPPPWGVINDAVDVVAGDRMLWPIRGRD